MGGQACVRSYRFTLDQLLEMINSGMSSDEIISAFSFLEPEDITDAKSYATHTALVGVDNPPPA